VEVVGGENDAVRGPVAAPEGTVHARQKEAAKEELLAEHGVEDLGQGDEGEPAPRTAEEVFTGVRVEELPEVAVLGERRGWQERVSDKEGQDERNQDQP
jgi:hypothetical protein